MKLNNASSSDLEKYQKVRDENRRKEKSFESWIEKYIKERYGKSLGVHYSKTDQLDIGESDSKTEIKHNHKYSKTGNLFIEIDKLTKHGEWIKSGIYREDNSRWYLIGDRNKFWLFKKEILKKEFGNNHYSKIPGYLPGFAFPTSHGYLLPIEKANQIAKKITLINDVNPNNKTKREPFQMELENIFKGMNNEKKST